MTVLTVTVLRRSPVKGASFLCDGCETRYADTEGRYRHDRRPAKRNVLCVECAIAHAAVYGIVAVTDEQLNTGEVTALWSCGTTTIVKVK